MKWERGRVGTGYWKLRLWLLGRHSDAYLIYCPPGASVPWHQDRVRGRSHWRANLRLWGEDNFEAKGPWVDLGRLHIFRSDFYHQVRKVKGRRLVFSVGVTI